MQVHIHRARGRSAAIFADSPAAHSPGWDHCGTRSSVQDVEDSPGYRRHGLGRGHERGRPVAGAALEPAP